MIRVRDLHFTYGGSKGKTLRGFNFELKQGEILGFLGPSGAGKSTTQKILTGLLKKYEGSVSVMGKEIRSWNRDFYEHIGVSFELPNLYGKLTALENLRFIASLYRVPTEDPLKLLELVGIAEQANMRVSSMSKGMKMRLNFVRALLHKPDLLFLDEPTAGLDPVNARNIKDVILQKKKEGRTVFLTTHNMTVADELCDRVAFIVDGEIKLIDSPRELKLRKGRRVIRVEYFRDRKVEEREFSLSGIGHNEDFLEILKGFEIRTIHTLEATLEDVFIEATGRRLS